MIADPNPVPGHLDEDARKAKEQAAIDENVEESFPASDPPSYAGGCAVGAPDHPANASKNNQADEKRKRKNP